MHLQAGTFIFSNIDERAGGKEFTIGLTLRSSNFKTNYYRFNLNLLKPGETKKNSEIEDN